jgi:hypothetical protein
MRYTNKFKIFSILFIFLIATFSCKKYLDKQPLDAITSEDFYKTAAQINQALTGVYNAYGARTVSPGLNNPTPYYSKMDLYTEIGLERGLNGTIGSGAYNTTTGTVAELWAIFYQVIQRANSLLFYMPRGQANMAPADYARVQAEAKVLRGLAYWHLITYFGDVPFFTGPLEQSEIYAATRRSKKEIIGFLISDLEGASTSLSWLPTDFGRVSRGVALGAAARLAILDKRFTDVIRLTDNVIANSPYGLNPSFQNLFRKNGQTVNANNEIMFIYPFGDADGGSFNYLNLVQGSRNQGGQSSHFPTQFLVDLFECTDGRTIDVSPLYNPARPNQNRDPRMKHTVIVSGDTVVVQGFTSNVFSSINRLVHTFNPTTSVVTLSTTNNLDSSNIFGPRQNGCGNLWRKYTNDRDINGTAGNLFKVGWVNMRFAEILLLNAEAKLENGSPAADVAVPLNRIRTRAGMPNVSATVLSNPNSLKQLVRREKTIEFANEGIHMADMRRWDDGAYAAKVMSGLVVGTDLSNSTFVTGQGLVINNPAPIPVFDAIYQVPITYPSATTTRLTRETRLFNANQHILCPIPQGEIDKVPTLVQNPGW